MSRRLDRCGGYRGGALDIILFNQSLEHFPDPKSAPHRAAGLLSPSGVSIVSVPDYGCNERVAFGLRQPDRYGPMRAFYLGRDPTSVATRFSWSGSVRA